MVLERNHVLLPLKGQQRLFPGIAFLAAGNDIALAAGTAAGKRK